MKMKTKMRGKHSHRFQRQLLLEPGAPLSAQRKWDLHFRQNWSWFFGCVQLLPLPIHTCTLSTFQKGFHQPMGRAHKHGKLAVKPLGFQTQNQTVHIYLTPHTPAQANKWTKGRRWMKTITNLPRVCLIFIGFYSKTIKEMLSEAVISQKGYIAL